VVVGAGVKKFWKVRSLRGGENSQRCWGLNEAVARGGRAGGIPGDPEGRLRG